MIGERIERARKGAGLSLRDLSQKVGISHTSLSHYEKERRTPTSQVLLHLAQALGVRGEYFLRPARVPLTGVEFRKHSRMGKRAQDRIQAVVSEHVERWLELLDLCPSFAQPAFAIPSLLDEIGVVRDQTTVEALAKALRRAWQLGLNPIPEVVSVLEDQGVVVVFVDEDDPGFNGLSARADGIPVIVVGKQWPGDRQRFTLLHELAHLILAERIDPDAPLENMCNAFAGAFLFPCTAVKQTFGPHRDQITANELYLAKHTYGVSMQTALLRAGQCHIIGRRTQQQMFQYFSRKGWRKQEPGNQVPRESTKRFEQLVLRGLAEGQFNESKAAELLGMSIASFHRSLDLENVA